MPNAIRFTRIESWGAIINTSSGSFDSESEQKMFCILQRAGLSLGCVNALGEFGVIVVIVILLKPRWFFRSCMAL